MLVLHLHLLRLWQPLGLFNVLHTCFDNPLSLPLTQLPDDLDVILRGFAPTALGECFEFHIKGFQLLGKCGVPLVQCGLSLSFLSVSCRFGTATDPVQPSDHIG